MDILRTLGNLFETTSVKTPGVLIGALGKDSIADPSISHIRSFRNPWGLPKGCSREGQYCEPEYRPYKIIFGDPWGSLKV
jgi:hypothetical protein